MYGIISDTHCHNWTQFSHTMEDGVNNRLRAILDSIMDAAKAVKEGGGEYLFHAGDLFHVRGHVAPSVLNPTLATFQTIVNMGIKPVIICGNHDAEFKDVNFLGSAIVALEGVGCTIVNKPMVFKNIDGVDVLCMPWFKHKSELVEAVRDFAASGELNGNTDLICHVALDGVFSHIRDSMALDPTLLLEAGAPFVKRIFAGHLHKHQKLAENVYSVGALNHHTWGDAGSQCGYMLVGDDIKQIPTTKGLFIQLTGQEDRKELEEKCAGNYIKAILGDVDDRTVKRFRSTLEKFGCAGSAIIVEAKQEINPDRLVIEQSESLESIVARFIDTNIDKSLSTKVSKAALEILGTV